MKKQLTLFFILMFVATLGLTCLQAQDRSSGGTSTVVVNIPAGPAVAPQQTAVATGAFKVRPEGTYTVEPGNGGRSGCNVLLLNAD